jgi:hypothetical protein
MSQTRKEIVASEDVGIGIDQQRPFICLFFPFVSLLQIPLALNATAARSKPKQINKTPQSLLPTIINECRGKTIEREKKRKRKEKGDPSLSYSLSQKMNYSSLLLDSRCSRRWCFDTRRELLVDTRLPKGEPGGGEERKRAEEKVGGGICGGGATGREGDFWLLLEIREHGRLCKVSVHAWPNAKNSSTSIYKMAMIETRAEKQLGSIC